MKALIFDVYGTLADTERGEHPVAFNRAFRELGCNWHWSPKPYGKLLSVASGKEHLQYYIDPYTVQSETRCGRELVQRLHESKTRHFANIVASGTILLRPSVRRLLLEARAAGLPLAIAATTSLDNVIAILAQNLGPESISWFEIIAAGGCVTNKKPAPDIYLYTLKKLGLSATECLALEGSHNGLQSSVAASIPAIVTPTDYTRQQILIDALTVLNDLGEPHQPAVWIRGARLKGLYVDLTQLILWHQLSLDKTRKEITSYA